jgi:hypothetical protein
MDVVSPGEETEDSYADSDDEAEEHTEDGESGDAAEAEQETARAESGSTKND